MDRNSIIGMSLISVVFILWFFLMQPSKEELERQKAIQDSLANEARIEAEMVAKTQSQINQAPVDPVQAVLADTLASDSLKTAMLTDRYGSFADAAKGSEKQVVLENSKIRVTLSTLGGEPVQITLKNYLKHDSTPLNLVNNNSNLGLVFFSNNRKIDTHEMYFVTEASANVNADTQAQTVKMRLPAGEGKYLEYEYSLEPDSYMLGYKINLHGVNDLINLQNAPLELHWDVKADRLERGDKWEKDNTMLHYKFYQDDVEDLMANTEGKTEELKTRVRWIGFKQQFFSSVIIADSYMEEAVVTARRTVDADSARVMEFGSEITLSTTTESVQSLPFHFFFGPNKYSVLKNIEVGEGDPLQLQKVIPYFGFGIGWINQFLIIPMFSFLSGFNMNVGIIILLMTIIIKLALFPFTYKSYVSMAEMRVLKPQIDDISKKFPADKAMERQQATMALYKRAGVSPMGGCLPMLLQFPILIAMFRFFPASIELRQQGFLWATDLSTYDSILSLPFTIPWYGAHVSLFTLLMTASSVLTMKFSNQQMSSSNQVPGMQFMMYMMPVMFMFWFNNYSSGLSYYYFLSNIITFGQTMLIRRFVDEDKILARLELNKKKPVKKSKFSQRLEDMAKQQQKRK